MANLDAIRFMVEGYEANSPFRFTVQEMADELDVDMETAQEFIDEIAAMRVLWEADFVLSGHNYVFGIRAYESLKELVS